MSGWSGCQLKYTKECHDANYCTEEGNEPCFKPYPPRMTNEEFTKKETELLTQLPVQFRSVLSSMAYERGHSGGMEEIISILSSLITDLLPTIILFEKDVTNNVTTNLQEKIKDLKADQDKIEGMIRDIKTQK